jgi:SAM-dependent methyltransferase
VSPSTSVSYDPRDYWSAVGEEIRRRPGGSLLAGDDSPFLQYKRVRFVDRMLTRLPVRGREVLEVGCGAGANLIELARAQPTRLVGCDISPVMVELASANTSGLEAVEVVALTDHRLPFDDGEFDTTYTVTVLQHNSDATVRALIAEMARVTREALVLIEDTTARRLDLTRFLGWVTGGTVTKESYVLRRVSAYARLGASVGWQLVEARPLNVYASDMMRVAVWLIGSRIGRASRREGEPLSQVQSGAERRLLAVTRTLDPWLPQRQGLTSMAFRARGVSCCRARAPA